MFSYVIRRVLLAFPTLIGITLVVFFIVAWSPGGTAADLMTKGEGMKPQEREAIRKYLNDRYGLDKPLIVQYGRWVNAISPIGGKAHGEGFPGSWGFGFKTPDLGMSMVRSRKVSELILSAIPVTLTLNLITLPMVYSFSVLTGIKAAKRRGQVWDVGSGTVLLAMWSFPVILAGLLLQGYLANNDKLGWFPVAELHGQSAESMTFLPRRAPEGWQAGYLLDLLWHLVLPVMCLTYGSFAFLSKLSRGAVLENINADYVRTARAKGVSEKNVLYHHVFRNSLIPLITFAAQLLPALIAGSVVVEDIFSLRGMGWLIVDSTFLKDREVVMAEAVIFGALMLISNLIADICYAIADPRVTFD